MKKIIILAAIVATAPLLSGCLVAEVAGTVVGLGVAATGAVVGGAVDLVTTSPQEQQQKDNERLKRENEELRKQQQQQAQKPQ